MRASSSTISGGKSGNVSELAAMTSLAPLQRDAERDEPADHCRDAVALGDGDLSQIEELLLGEPDELFFGMTWEPWHLTLLHLHLRQSGRGQYDRRFLAICKAKDRAENWPISGDGGALIGVWVWGCLRGVAGVGGEGDVE